MKKWRAFAEYLWVIVAFAEAGEYEFSETTKEQPLYGKSVCSKAS